MMPLSLAEASKEKVEDVVVSKKDEAAGAKGPAAAGADDALALRGLRLARRGWPRPSRRRSYVGGVGAASARSVRRAAFDVVDGGRDRFLENAQSTD